MCPLYQCRITNMGQNTLLLRLNLSNTLGLGITFETFIVCWYLWLLVLLSSIFQFMIIINNDNDILFF